MPRFKLPKPPREQDFHSVAHEERVTSRIGLWLGIAFGACFVTGLLSHNIQHPSDWFSWPSRPVNLYRITQGIHVLSGIAAIPLLLAKLWSVYPKLFSRPFVKSLGHALERGSIFVLIGAAFFELLTGWFNATQNYPWHFFFPPAHYAVAWIAIGALLLHIAIKLPIIRNALKLNLDENLNKEIKDQTSPAEETGVFNTRRGFLRATWLTAAAALVVTAGNTVPWLRDVSALSTRSDRGPQGLPVNRTAAAAGVSAVDPQWRLTITGPTEKVQLSLDQLRAMPQTTAELPIACVEGWSQTATWTGVRIIDLLRMVDVEPGATLAVTSMERSGLYSSSTLPGPHTQDPLTLLALKLNGETLHIDHGYPCRIIAPSRPGVLQTKWVQSLAVLS